MAEWEELGRFLVGLPDTITDNVTRALQNVCQSFSDELAGLSTVISGQGVSQIVGSFDGEPTKYKDWIELIEMYMLLADGDDNQPKCPSYQTCRGAIGDYIQRLMAEYPENSWEQLKSELNVRLM